MFQWKQQVNRFGLCVIIFSGRQSGMDDVGIRFLVATDVHLGHQEKHPIRSEDSYEGFQEVIDQAKSNNIDFLLLGGDLFDEVNPSKQCFFKCLNMLKENVFGIKRVNLNVTMNGDKYRSNFENEDVNISLPIFTIHGNHDYPTNDFGKISACDLLQASNYVNYFGKFANLQEIVIRPLIITKAGSSSKIALYGLGYIKDLILNQLFEEKKVRFEPPQGNINDYVKIFVFHQNRYKKGFRSGAPLHQSFNPQNIPEWMNLVIWGHEHQAIYKLQYQMDRPVYQPGSTILTSFIESQSFKKQCVLINIHNNSYQIQSILLQRSYRPMKCLTLDYSMIQTQSGAQSELFQYIENAIVNSIAQLAKQSKKLPIIRIKVECGNEKNTVRAKMLEAKYATKVANGQKIIVFWARKLPRQMKMQQDDLILKKIKNRQIIKGQTSVIEQIQGMLQKNIQKIDTTIYPKKSLFEIVSYLTKVENISCTEIIKRRFEDLDKERARILHKNINKANGDKELQFKKAMKYYKDRYDLMNNGNINIKAYNVDNQKDFLALKGEFMNQNKYLVQSRVNQERFSGKIEEQNSNTGVKQVNSSKDTNKSISAYQSSRESILKKAEHGASVISDDSFNRSDSEDCCKRAEKTEYDEFGSKVKFEEAEKKLKDKISGKLKKNANIQPAYKQKQKPIKEEKKQIKNVRFSSDFV